MFIANAVIAVGSAITMIFNFYALLGGRLLIGYGAGAYTVIAPLFISETSPTSVAGSMGAINQFMVCAGIMIADILGFIVPYAAVKGGKEDEQNPEIFTTKIWRVIFIIPAVLSALQTLLVLFIFRHDTPKYYKQNKMTEAVQRVEDLIYAEKVSEINKSVLEETNNENKNDKVSLGAH